MFNSASHSVIKGLVWNRLCMVPLLESQEWALGTYTTCGISCYLRDHASVGSILI